MDVPLQIAFKDMDRSDFLAGLIEERVGRLEHFHPRINACRVVVETPHRSAETGKPPLGIAVEVSVPGGKMLVAKEAQERRDSKGDHTAVVNRAFERIERQLEAHADMMRGEVKMHEADGQTGHVVRLFPEQSYGFIEVAGSPDLYFTRNAVLGKDFDELKAGDQVRVTIATTEGPMGPQASSVRPLGDLGKLI